MRRKLFASFFKEISMKYLSSFTFFVLFFIASTLFLSPAEAEGDSRNTVVTLDEVNKDLEELYSRGTHMVDQGRIFILKKSASDVSVAIQEKGPVHRTTINALTNMIIKFKFSSQFFELIRTKRNQDLLQRILSGVARVREDMGMDDDPYLKILKPNLIRIAEIIEGTTKDSQVSREIRDKLNSLLVPLANAIALADQGDRPIAFKIASEFYLLLRKLYPLVRSLADVPSKSAVYLELIGTNEFIGEYAQVELGK